MFHTASQIVSTAGPAAMYDGVTAAYLKQWTYGSFRLGLYSYMLDDVQKKLKPEEKVMS
jgi:hypothetical protein